MRGFILEAPLLGGCLGARPAAYQVSRYSGNPQTSKKLKSSHHLVLVRQLKLHDSRRLWVCSAKAQSRFILRPLVTPGDLNFKMHITLAENKTNLSRCGCQTVIKTLSPCRHDYYFMAKQVMYCGIIVDDRKAFRATFFLAHLIPPLITLPTRTPHTPYTP